MNPFQRRSLIAIVTGLWPLLSVAAEDMDYRTAKIELTHQMAKDSVGYDDLCATMSGIGIDFPVLLQRALDGHDGAVRLLIWAGENAGLDGAASEGYSYTMVRAARKIGDDKMATAAKELKIASFRNTQMYFHFEFGFDDDEVAATAEINRLFPKFWRQITKRVEQGGADQPATAPESKPDGSENPIPESEVRPQ